jgi:uncharacterized membrane protein YdjX (TVP38/TMEM64 family)
MPGPDSAVRPRATGLAALVSTPRRLFLTLLVALGMPILATFLFFEDPLIGWTERFVDGRRSMNAIAVACAALLAADLLLPIPSSLVATLAASLLDPARAFLAIVVGSAASASGGWLLGRLLRGAALARFVDPEALAHADASFGRWGLWAYACTRAVPILAEEFAILAGVHRVGFWRVFLPLTLAATLPMAAFYLIAVRAAKLVRGEDPPFWLLLLVASVLPLLGLALARTRLLRGRRS